MRKFTYSRQIQTIKGPEIFTAVEFDSFDEAIKAVEKGIYDRGIQLAAEKKVPFPIATPTPEPPFPTGGGHTATGQGGAGGAGVGTGGKNTSNEIGGSPKTE